MRSLKMFLLVAVMAVIVLGIFYACQKDEVLDSNVLNKEKKSLPYSDILTNSVSIGVFPAYLRELGYRYEAEGQQGYLCFSLNSDRTNVRYGIITENTNAELYNYITFHVEEIILFGSCDEWKKFDNLDDALDFAEQGMYDCCDITIYDYDENGKKIWIVILEPNPTLSLPPRVGIFNRSISINGFDNFNTTMMQHHLEVLGEYVIFSINEDEDIIKYGYFTEENNRALYMFLSKFEKLNDEKQLMFATLKKKFSSTDIRDIREFAKEELEKGYVITITCQESGGKKTYTAASWER